MNIKRLRRLAHRLQHTKPADFNMAEYGYCSTACCVAGHARLMAGKRSAINWHLIRDGAREYLDLADGTAGRLFAPNSNRPYGASPKQAARVIRNLIKTGKVQWTEEVMGKW